jgi:hypothetical protein
MEASFVDKKEAELIARLDAATTAKKPLSKEEAAELQFEAMLFLIRTRGL